MAATRQPLLPTAWDGLGAPPPPRRSSKLGSTNAVPISGRRGRSLIWLAILLAAGFVVWLLMRRDVSLEDLRRTAADRSNEWLGAIAERLLAVHEQGAVRKLTTEELERLADIPWLESVLDAPTSESGSAASTSTTPPAPAPPPATRRRPETSDQELIAQHVKPTTFIPEVASFDKIAIAVKTGAATALQRVPVQAATFLRHVKNWILIGETPGMFVGERPIIDVYSSLYSEPPFPDHLGAHAGHGPNASFARAPKMSLSESGGAGHRRLLKRHNEGGHKEKDAIVPDNSAEGWKKDAHKNLPGFVHLWNNFPNADWYFMIDDDTYLFLENVVKAVEGLNPENAYYFGTPTVSFDLGGRAVKSKFSDSLCPPPLLTALRRLRRRQRLRLRPTIRPRRLRHHDVPRSPHPHARRGQPLHHPLPRLLGRRCSYGSLSSRCRDQVAGTQGAEFPQRTAQRQVVVARGPLLETDHVPPPPRQTDSKVVRP